MSQVEQSENGTVADGSYKEIVSFKAAGQDFCVEIMSVREIRVWSVTTVVPHAPDYMMGVMNLRGAVVPVIDLSRRLGLGATEGDDRHVIIIAMVGTQMVGLLVEAVSDILSIPVEEVQATPELASEVARSFIAGVICVDDRMLRMIDLDRLLAVSEVALT